MAKAKKSPAGKPATPKKRPPKAAKPPVKKLPAAKPAAKKGVVPTTPPTTPPAPPATPPVAAVPPSVPPVPSGHGGGGAGTPKSPPRGGHGGGGPRPPAGGPAATPKPPVTPVVTPAVAKKTSVKWYGDWRVWLGFLAAVLCFALAATAEPFVVVLLLMGLGVASLVAGFAGSPAVPVVAGIAALLLASAPPVYGKVAGCYTECMQGRAKAAEAKADAIVADFRDEDNLKEEVVAAYGFSPDGHTLNVVLASGEKIIVDGDRIRSRADLGRAQDFKLLLRRERDADDPSSSVRPTLIAVVVAPPTSGRSTRRAARDAYNMRPRWRESAVSPMWLQDWAEEVQIVEIESLTGFENHWSLPDPDQIPYKEDKYGYSTIADP